jgi:hypothetical protein
VECPSSDDHERSSLNTKIAKITKAIFLVPVQAFKKGVFGSFVFAFAFAGCTQKPSEPQPIVSVTRPVGSWQGRGTATVGDIPSETGRFRILWETSNESPSGSGRFKLTLRSAISGRTLGIVADHKGIGAGTEEYDEGPRTYDFLVESANVDWKFRVEETTGAFANGSSPSVPAKR